MLGWPLLPTVSWLMSAARLRVLVAVGPRLADSSASYLPLRLPSLARHPRIWVALVGR